MRGHGLWGAPRALVAGAAVYALVAACSGGAESVTAPVKAALADASTGAGSGGGAACSCAPVEPQVDVETCSAPPMKAGDPPSVALHAYDGKSAAELASVVAMGRFAAGSEKTIAGLTMMYQPLPTLVSDGKVGVACAGSFDYVDFVLPNP